MKYAIADSNITLFLKANGIYIDHPFEKEIEKYSIYELKEKV